MIHNNKVYANADEKFVKGTIIYADSSDTLYRDKECTKEIGGDELLEMFCNGGLIVAWNGNLLLATGFTFGTDYATLEVKQGATDKDFAVYNKDNAQWSDSESEYYALVK